jgi:hypothetical protein
MKRSRFISNQVKEFNKNGIGQKVIYHPILRQAGCNCAIRTHALSNAYFMNGIAKVYLQGENEWVPFHHVKVVNNSNAEYLQQYCWCPEKGSTHYW